MGKSEHVFRADRLRELQYQRRYTQLEMAALIGINQSQLQRYLNGKSEPTAAVVVRMAVKLGVSSDYLLGLVERPRDTYTQLGSQERALLNAVERGLDINALKAMVAYLSGKSGDK